MMRRPVAGVLCAVAPLMAVLAGCGSDPAESAVGSETAAGVPDAGPAQESSPAQDGGSGQSYLDRLTPVAKLKNAVDIKVDGKDAWVTVPVESTSATSVLECLQLLPAAEPGETLTVIYSDGVEELCEWPDED